MSRQKKKLEMKMKQDRFVLKYVEELKNYNKQKEVCKENRPKAYVYIMGHCGKVMENRVLETK